MNLDDIFQKCLHITGNFESGNDYSKFNPNDNNAGISFGLIQWNQRRGELPKLLQRMHEADPAEFVRIFSEVEEPNLTNEQWVRTSPLLPRWESRFHAAGQVPAFQQVQRDLAREVYFEPARQAAEAHGLLTERAICLLFDVAVQLGPGWMRKHFDADVKTCDEDDGKPSVLKTFAVSADMAAGGHRRHDIMADRSLSDVSLIHPTLKRGDRGPEVHDLQAALIRLEFMRLDFPDDPPVPERATLGLYTERCVKSFQESHGLKPDGIVGPLTRKAIDEALAALPARQEGGQG